MTGVASPEKPSSSKKKSDRKEYKQEYKQLSSIMGVMNNLRKQVGRLAFNNTRGVQGAWCHPSV